MPCGSIFRNQCGQIVNPAGVGTAARARRGPGLRLLPPAASAGERRVDGARRVDPALRLFPAFLATQGGQVEEGVGAAEDVGTPGEGRVGVEDLLALSQETAEAGHLAGPVRSEERRV